MFVLRPARNLEVDRADEIVTVVEIDLDLLLAECVCQKLLRMVDEYLKASRRILTQVMKNHDHPFFDFLQYFHPTTRIDFPELCFNHLLRRLRTVCAGFHRLSELGQST